MDSKQEDINIRTPAEDGSVPVAPGADKLQTNRKKAIIFQNIYCIFQVGYLATMKHAVSNLKVDPLDQVIYRNIISTFFGLFVALCSKQSFAVAKGMRWTLFARSCFGAAGNTAMTFGIALVPLVF